MLEIKFDKFPVLETERLLLRPFTLDDAEVFLDLNANEKVTQYFDRPKMQNMDEAIKTLNKISTSFEKNEGVTWAIELKETKIIIGHLTYWRIIKEHYRAEMGYSLFPEYWRKGFMSEAIQKVIDFGFLILKFHSIEANVDPRNIASMKLLERSGFLREGYLKENFYFNGKFFDTALYSLLNKKEL
jgi:[ribosomal protein S5]-alanine N-acetyltransferase